MSKFIVMAFAMLIFVGCNNAPAPTRAPVEQYTVESEQQAPAIAGLIVNIKVAEQPTESDVKSIAESVIASRKGQYQNIIVRTYLTGSSEDQLPYAISRLENGAITHLFNQQAAPQRIPTH